MPGYLSKWIIIYHCHLSIRQKTIINTILCGLHFPFFRDITFKDIHLYNGAVYTMVRVRVLILQEQCPSDHYCCHGLST